MSKAVRIHELNKAYQRDQAFAHLRDDGGRFVPGDGPLDAHVAVIGEAPGRHEDRECRPFVGRSGRVLDRMLAEHASWSRDKCYITNVVKYRPPDGRAPDPGEVSAGKWYVGQEIVTVGSDIVVLVGACAYEMVFPDGRISSDHGTPRDLKGRTYLPTYHPAVALYNRLMIDDLRKDYAALARLLV